MATPKRILFVHHRPELGGAPSSLAGLIGGLDRARFEATVYCPSGPAADLFEREGARVVRGPVAAFTHVWASYYRGLRWGLLVRELVQLPHALLCFARLLRRERFDLVHLNDSPLVYTALIARAFGLPVVWHLRSSLAREGLDARGRAIGRIVAETGRIAIAIDHDVARSFPGVQATIVQNSVDLAHFRPMEARGAKERLGLRPDAVTIGMFGYLYAKKGWPDFIRAAQRLRQRGIDAQFVIVGGGVRPPEFFSTRHGRVLSSLKLTSDEESRARALVRTLGLTEHVSFLPFSVDPRDAYWALDIVTFPNRGAGLGRAVIEAAACARPVVASGSLDGAGLLIPGETGLLLPRRSPDALATALETLATDEELRARIGSAARAHAEANFSQVAAAARVMEIYDGVLT